MNTRQYAYWLRRRLGENPDGVLVPSHLLEGKPSLVKEVLFTDKLDPASDRTAPQYAVIRGQTPIGSCWAGASLDSPCDFKALNLEGQNEAQLEQNELFSCDLEVYGYNLEFPEKIPMHEIEELNRKNGYHFFSLSAMRSFRSRIGSFAYLNTEGTIAFFVTSEKNGMQPRHWRARSVNMATGEIDQNLRKELRHLPFNNHRTAQKVCLRLAKGEI